MDRKASPKLMVATRASPLPAVGYQVRELSCATCSETSKAPKAGVCCHLRLGPKQTILTKSLLTRGKVEVRRSIVKAGAVWDRDVVMPRGNITVEHRPWRRQPDLSPIGDDGRYQRGRIAVIGLVSLIKPDASLTHWDLRCRDRHRQRLGAACRDQQQTAYPLEPSS